eukprot:15088912-Alexandrium_andersonii.AAC.1
MHADSLQVWATGKHARPMLACVQEWHPTGKHVYTPVRPQHSLAPCGDQVAHVPCLACCWSCRLGKHAWPRATATH